MRSLAPWNPMGRMPEIKCVDASPPTCSHHQQNKGREGQSKWVKCRSNV